MKWKAVCYSASNETNLSKKLFCSFCILKSLSNNFLSSKRISFMYLFHFLKINNVTSNVFFANFRFNIALRLNSGQCYLRRMARYAIICYTKFNRTIHIVLVPNLFILEWRNHFSFILCTQGMDNKLNGIYSSFF